MKPPLGLNAAWNAEIAATVDAAAAAAAAATAAVAATAAAAAAFWMVTWSLTDPLDRFAPGVWTPRNLPPLSLRSWLRSIYMEGEQVTGVITPSVVLLILFNAAYGLCISAVLKHLGAMVSRHAHDTRSLPSALPFVSRRHASLRPLGGGSPGSHGMVPRPLPLVRS